MIDSLDAEAVAPVDDPHTATLVDTVDDAAEGGTAAAVSDGGTDAAG